MTDPIHRRERKLVDRHFAGRATPEQQLAMWTHLDACPDCRHYFDRHAVLAGLDPKAVSVEDCLAAGLGFLPKRPTRRAPLVALVLGPAAAVLAVWAISARSPGANPEFTARHAGTPGPALHVYRVSRDRSTPLGSEMPATEELAFAYENPTGFDRLMVVAVDERGKLYWYHPDPDLSDAAVAIAREGGRQELPEAIRHDYGAGVLRILGIFGSEELSVARVGALLDASGCSGVRARLPQTACAEVKVLVRESKP